MSRCITSYYIIYHTRSPHPNLIFSPTTGASSSRYSLSPPDSYINYDLLNSEILKAIQPTPCSTKHIPKHLHRVQHPISTISTCTLKLRIFSYNPATTPHHTPLSLEPNGP